MIRKPPANMPSIDLIVNELVVRGRTLGRLEVDAHNDVEDNVPVWHLDKLDLSNPDATLSATANWRTISGPVGFPADADDNAPAAPRWISSWTSPMPVRWLNGWACRVR